MKIWTELSYYHKDYTLISVYDNKLDQIHWDDSEAHKNLRVWIPYNRKSSNLISLCDSIGTYTWHYDHVTLNLDTIRGDEKFRIYL